MASDRFKCPGILLSCLLVTPPCGWFLPANTCSFFFIFLLTSGIFTRCQDRDVGLFLSGKFMYLCFNVLYFLFLILSPDKCLFLSHPHSKSNYTTSSLWWTYTVCGGHYFLRWCLVAFAFEVFIFIHYNTLNCYKFYFVRILSRYWQTFLTSALALRSGEFKGEILMSGLRTLLSFQSDLLN